MSAKRAKVRNDHTLDSIPDDVYRNIITFVAQMEIIQLLQTNTNHKQRIAGLPTIPHVNLEWISKAPTATQQHWISRATQMSLQYTFSSSLDDLTRMMAYAGPHLTHITFDNATRIRLPALPNLVSTSGMMNTRTFANNEVYPKLLRCDGSLGQVNSRWFPNLEEAKRLGVNLEDLHEWVNLHTLTIDYNDLVRTWSMGPDIKPATSITNLTIRLCFGDRRERRDWIPNGTLDRLGHILPNLEHLTIEHLDEPMWDFTFLHQLRKLKSCTLRVKQWSITGDYNDSFFSNDFTEWFKTEMKLTDTHLETLFNSGIITFHDTLRRLIEFHGLSDMVKVSDEEPFEIIPPMPLLTQQG
jgi:hypothetical protein